MSKDDSLRDLIDRVERATWPDRYLDAAIHSAILSELDFAVHVRPAPSRNGRVIVHYQGGTHGTRQSPCYTLSIDSAKTLVPEGHSFNLGNDVRPWAHVWFDVPAYDGKPYEGRAATPALALVAASLRARLTGEAE